MAFPGMLSMPRSWYNLCPECSVVAPFVFWVQVGGWDGVFYLLTFPFILRIMGSGHFASDFGVRQTKKVRRSLTMAQELDIIVSGKGR